MWSSFFKEADVRTELKPHQRRVVEKMKKDDQPGLVVAHGLGSGKTLTAIATQDALGLPATVAVPAALQANYIKEMNKHLVGTSPEASLTTLQRISRAGDIGQVNPLLIVDEAHKAREINTATYRALKSGIEKTDKRLMLTASPFYNRPSDIAPLINLAAGDSVLEAHPSEFKNRFVQERTIKPGVIGWLKGAKPGVVEELNPREKKHLSETFRKWVDYHPGSTEGFPEVKRETVEVPMTQRQLQIYDSMIGKAPMWVAHKVKAGLPPSKQESKDLNAYLSAVRQISNSTREFAPNEVPQEPKIDTAFQRMQQTLNRDETAKGVVYSNFLKSGLKPYKERLDQAGIPYGEFTGEMKKKERDQLIREYNEGKKKVLLLSSAGGEGLDLKGTRLVQMMEPHWNAEKLKQVEGRGIRYKSHDHLPEEKRNVTVESYLATRPERKGIGGMILGKSTGGSSDQFLRTMSGNKEKLIDQFRGLLDKESSVNPAYILKLAKILGGFYKGEPSDPDKVKKVVDFQGIKIHVDRPKGFIMMGEDSKGTPWKRRYQVDYGFIPKTLGGDGDGLDVFLGPNKKSKMSFWAVQQDDDGGFDEYKIFLGYDNRDEAIATYRKHIPKKYFGRLITMTVDMMKAMLGTNPEEAVKASKTASVWGAFFRHMTKESMTRALLGPDPLMDEEQLRNVLMARRVSMVPVSSLDHPGHDHLKRDLIGALIQGTIGAGSQ